MWDILYYYYTFYNVMQHANNERKYYWKETFYVLFFFPLSRQAFSESLAAQDAGDQDSERDEDGAHRVQEDRLLAEVHVLLSKLCDDNIADGVQSSGAEKKITMKILLFNELFLFLKIREELLRKYFVGDGQWSDT